MFAYCNNNPIRASDPRGTSAIGALVAAAAIGAAAGAISTWITGGTGRDIAYAALDGAIEGIIIAVVPESVILFAGHQFIETMTACGNSGLDPIWCYTFAFAASAATFGLPSTGDDLTDIFVDTTFGMAETLIVDGSITAAQNASSSNNPNAGASDPHTMPHAAGHGISTVWKNHNVALLN